jgi:hypothetical protein
MYQKTEKQIRSAGRTAALRNKEEPILIEIDGRRSITNSFNDTEYRKFTVEEIAALLAKGGYGMLSTNMYTIEGAEYIASGLSINKDTVPVERDGKIVLTTYFRRFLLSKLPEGIKGDDPNELIQVDVLVDPANDLFVTVVGA